VRLCFFGVQLPQSIWSKGPHGEGENGGVIEARLSHILLHHMLITDPISIGLSGLRFWPIVNGMFSRVSPPMTSNPVSW